MLAVVYPSGTKAYLTNILSFTLQVPNFLSQLSLTIIANDPGTVTFEPGTDYC